MKASLPRDLCLHILPKFCSYASPRCWWWSRGPGQACWMLDRAVNEISRNFTVSGVGPSMTLSSLKALTFVSQLRTYFRTLEKKRPSPRSPVAEQDGAPQLRPGLHPHDAPDQRDQEPRPRRGQRPRQHQVPP